MNFHFIAIGGSAMHNLAIDMSQSGHHVTGSDDEIYEPAKTRLAAKGLLPEKDGWFPDRITTDLDAIILGMHARKDNPELLRAMELGIKIYSYPEFIYHQSVHKKRVVIAGSHGKTTTTSMILHVLKSAGMDFDYLVGAQIKGFETMVRITDAPVIIIEGDEYLSSPLDLRPKMLHYNPHVAVITGIAWDHINVFPTFESYVEQFELFMKTIPAGGRLFYDVTDESLNEVIRHHDSVYSIPYRAFETVNGRKNVIISDSGQESEISVFGTHNLKNLKAAWLVCKELGISEEDFLKYIKSFEGASKRLQSIYTDDQTTVFLDFAHAPSKVKATVEAVKEQFADKKITALLELHTFSSLNKDFVPQYAYTLDKADEAVVFFSSHTMDMKKMPGLDQQFVQESFSKEGLRVINNAADLKDYLVTHKGDFEILLLMTSGNFEQTDILSVLNT